MDVRVGVDIGGTFTDLALFDPGSGTVHVSKALSTPRDPIVGVQEAIAKVGVSNEWIRDFVHGTTVATNALLERKKATPGLIATEGFRDVVFIQRMNRKHHYDLQWDKPRPFVERRHCFEVAERVNYKGDVLEPLDEEKGRAAAEQLRAAGVTDIAVCFLFSYVNPVHELRMREIIAEVFPEAMVSLSHEVYPRWREYDRMSTSLADAFLKGLVKEYVGNLATGLEEVGVRGNFLIMKSNGGIQKATAAAGKPVDLIMSGPVGGVLSAMHFGELTGRSNLITMDMGGTSFDVSLVSEGHANRTVEYEIEWGLPVYTPMIDVRSIGAGGGSIAWIDKGGLLRVGPQSAGANPGPACYGAGGQDPTVTDANLVLGRLNPSYFLGGELELDVDAAERALGKLGEQLGMTVEDVASSIIELVDFNMVNEIRLVSIDRGLDPRDFALVSFGGAGSLHAGSLAEIIGIEEVLVPIHQGIFSAFGIMTADMRVDESVTANFRSDLVDVEALSHTVGRIREQAVAQLRDEGYEGDIVLEHTAEMRYLGQNYSTEVALSVTHGIVTDSGLAKTFERFHAEHERLYGYHTVDEIVELVHLNVTALGRVQKPHLRKAEAGGDMRLKESRPVYFREAGWIDTPIYDRMRLPVAATINGPAIVEEATSTTLIRPGHKLEVDPYRNLVLTIVSRPVEGP